MPALRASPSSGPRAVLAVALLAAVVPLLYAAYTNHAWEDYYITLRSSRNLVEGHGLVFQPGERVHTFTSPLGVLVPAACLWLAQGHDGLALWLFRLVGAAALAGAAALVWQRATAAGLGRIGRVVLFGLWLADPKLIDCSTNGMETAILVALAAGLWGELERAAGPRLPVLAGLYAGLMWTRPDAFILAGALTAARLLLAGNATPRPSLPLVAGAIVVGVLLYLPWVLWAWSYYGSPIPHTIAAKATQTAPPRLLDVALVPLRAVGGNSMCEYLFLPANYLFGGWPAALRIFARVLAVTAALAWLLPGWALAGRRASLALFAGLFYICVINLYAWYVPPWSALAAIALGFLVDHGHRQLAATRPLLRRLVAGLGVALVLVQAGQLAATAWQLRVQQRLIEDQGRHQIGLWLREHAAAGDTLFLEPLGYIGYFSQLKTYDYPGLSSNEVTDAIRAGDRRYGQVIARLRPDWLVLRPLEIEREGLLGSAALAEYELVKSWDARPALAAIAFLPGRGWLDYDARFQLYRRRQPVKGP